MKVTLNKNEEIVKNIKEGNLENMLIGLRSKEEIVRMFTK